MTTSINPFESNNNSVINPFETGTSYPYLTMAEDGSNKSCDYIEGQLIDGFSPLCDFSDLDDLDKEIILANANSEDRAAIVCGEVWSNEDRTAYAVLYRPIQTLGQLADYINEYAANNPENAWDNEAVDLAIEANGWNAADGFDTYSVCDDGRQKVIINDRDEAEVIDL